MSETQRDKLCKEVEKLMNETSLAYVEFPAIWNVLYALNELGYEIKQIGSRDK